MNIKAYFFTDSSPPTCWSIYRTVKTKIIN